MKYLMATGAFGALMSVILGALGAHKLGQFLSTDALSAFNTAVEYQMYHSLAILLVCVLPISKRRAIQAGICFLVGTVLFSGSIYGLTIFGAGFLGPVTPLGGIILMSGWIILIFTALRNASHG